MSKKRELEKELELEVPTIKFNNGLVIANFSSPHPFKFNNGFILDACSTKRCKKLSLFKEEIKVLDSSRKFFNVQVIFRRNLVLEKELEMLEKNPKIDIILVPLPILTFYRDNPRFSKIRGCIVEDRVNKIISCEKFSI